MTRDGVMVSTSSSPPGPEPLPSYKFGEKLGQGSFGSVYRALNWTTGETCAVKQVGLANIPKSELPDIMSEIELLKNLNHPNIVQYRGFVKTSSHLYIILEYCENGSLHGVLKKFGRFPEQLVGLYILQVLHGLVYLHDQGVIHRDIKGSNILATKEGGIKLADFGVATYAGGPGDSAVVGSPYWMAPEVVDQSGATTSSDIWSLGALVVELLTGKPPYHFLDPMPALFRIVNDDDGPAIPDGSSAVVRDFLGQCFQKDGNLRCGARKLLKHPWMLAAKKQVEEQNVRKAANAGAGGSRQERPRSSYEDEVRTVKEWNEALRAPASSRPLPSRMPLTPAARRQLRRSSVDLSSTLNQGAASPLALPSAARQRLSAPPPITPASTLPLPLTLLRSEPAVFPGSDVVGEEEGDNWDSDFEDDISVSKLAAALDRDASESSSAPEEDEDDDQEGTIRPPKLTVTATASTMTTSKMTPIVEDYSDMVEEEDDVFKGRVERLRDQTNDPAHKRILHPKDISSSASPLAAKVNILPATPPVTTHHSPQPKTAVPAPRTPVRSPLTPIRSSSAAELIGQLRTASPSPRATLLARTSGPRPDTPSRRSSAIIDEYREDEREGEDYSDVFGGAGTLRRSAAGGSAGRQASTHALANSSQSEGLQLTTRLSSRSWLGDEDSDEDDPFASVDHDAGDSAGGTSSPFDLQANAARDQLARACSTMTELIEVIERDEADEFEVREAALEMVAYLEDSAEIRAHFVKSHGMLAVVDALQTTRSRDILGVLLRIVNIIIGSDPETLEKICLVGGCPVLMSFASNKFSREIRLEAALFIGAMCRTSLLTLQMFVSCRGLSTLVEMMDENYAERKDLVWMAVDGIARVFEMHGPTPRNDFCRIFSHEGLLEPLSSALVSVSQDSDDLAESAKAKIVAILLIFAQSDRKVKEAMACRAVVLRLIKALRMLQPKLLAPLLKTIKNLTMLPSALEVLQNANAIEALVVILSEEFEGKIAAEIQNHVINALFNLCRLSKVRQEEAAIAGAIPILQRVVSSSSPLKQFALPILCDFAHASKTCRKLLWKHDGLNFYLTLLRDSFWSAPSLEAILSWLQDETARVEDCLLETPSLEALLRVFCKTKTVTFEALLEPFYKVLRTSSAISSRLAQQSHFLKRIIDRLSRGGKAVVRLNLLRITKTVYDSLPTLTSSSSSSHRSKFITTMLEPVMQLASNDPAILVKELAKELKREFARAKEDAGGGSAQRLGPVRSRSVRRSTSEGSAGLEPARGGGSVLTPGRRQSRLFEQA